MFNMRFIKIVSSIVLVLLIILVIYKAQENKVHYIKGNIFGTYYQIKIRSQKIAPNIQDYIEKDFASINNSMSVFNPQSEISKINSTAENVDVSISEELYFVLETAKKVYEESFGWFDPTIGRLIELWGFGTKHEQNIPSKGEIDNELKYVGFKNIILKKGKIEKKFHQTNINLSSIAKGYAVDKVSNTLEKLGYKNYVVDIGGEIKVKGSRDDKSVGWNIGVATPLENNFENSIIIEISDYALATSGDYRNFYYSEGKKYAHTISPFNGYPVDNNLVSVSVFHPSCIMADAYATAIMSMGEKQASKFMAENNISAILMIKKPDNTIDYIFSKGAKDLLGGANE